MGLMRLWRLHPRMGAQRLVVGRSWRRLLRAALPPLVPFRDSYQLQLVVVDWDHRMPSRRVLLRVYAYYGDAMVRRGLRAFRDRYAAIARKPSYPEFDAPDFGELPADEAYDVELDLGGMVQRIELVSPWARELEPAQDTLATELVRSSSELSELLQQQSLERSSGLQGGGSGFAGGYNPALGSGGLPPQVEAVRWVAPCEVVASLGPGANAVRQAQRWLIDVWCLLALLPHPSGHMWRARSFFVDLEAETVVGSREISVRTI
jgi:hypothetical protein